MTNPKITVVLPCYNVQDYVSSCLDSIINNSFKDLEIICVNDKSTDDTLSIIQNYAKKDKRIKIINLSENKGVGFARNIGLSESRGEWVSFIDPDDYVDLQFYEKLYDQTLENKNSDVIKAGITINDVARKTTFKSSLNQRILKHKFYFFGEHTTGLYKVSFLRTNNLSYPENIKTGQDVCFLSNVVLHANNIQIVDDVYYHYTCNRPGSLDSKVLSHDKIVSRLKMLDYKVNLLKQYHVLSKEDRILFCEQQIMNHWSGLIHKTDNIIDQKLVFGWLVNNKGIIGKEILKNLFNSHKLRAINYNNFNGFMMSPKNYKIFYKEKLKNGRRHIYLFGIKVFSYRKKAQAQKVNILCINKSDFDKKIKSFSKIGLDIDSGRNPRIIVSLTSFPARMYDIHYCLYSLLNQSLKPDMVILWLGIDQFPNKEKDLPVSVLNLIKNGLTIKWCQDIKSYKKLIPALSEFPNDIIVTADDDVYYPDYWLKTLYDAYINDKTMIHCLRAHRVSFDKLGNILPYNSWKHQIQNVQPSFNNFFTGVGGVLYPPHSLHKDVTKQETFIRLAPNADDIWFWAMAIKNGTKINVINSVFKTICINPERELGITGEPTLMQLNVRQGGNDSQLAAVIKEFNLLPMISFNSGEYWEERYKKMGNSGAGSYGRLAHFKADVLNKFVRDNKINSVIEFGVGDGNNLSLFKFNKYLGIDVSKTILASVSKMFSSDSTKSFIHTTEFNNQRADLSLSLDVIYHLLEDEVFNKYMNNLFAAAEKFVIIYASNKDEPQAQHVRHRKFTDWVNKNKPDWKLQEIIVNKYPFDETDPDNTSFADFYIFKK